MTAAEGTDSTQALSRREQAKEERRRRILETAERLTRERGNTGFSMRELAEAARVAFATPFNLFDSKERLLASLLFRRMWPRQEALATSPVASDPIGHVLEFTAAAFATYADDAELFRPLLQTVISSASAPQDRMLETGADLWNRCLEPARSNGLLREEVNDAQLDRTFHLLFRGALLGWVRGEATAEETADHLSFAVAALLAGAVVESARDRVLAQVERLG